MRQHIADVAQHLFHERGFEAVTVADVALDAEVGEQTVYNYFATKEGLVFDEAGDFADRFVAMVVHRRPGESFVAALRRETHAFLDRLASWPANPHWRGAMPYLVATSPAVRRGWLSLVESYSRLIADRLLVETAGQLPAAAAGMLGWSFVTIFHVIVDAVGQAMRTEARVDELIAGLRPQIDAAIDILECGLGDTPGRSGVQPRGDQP
jgi:AcrR family transcriptional regulator